MSATRNLKMIMNVLTVINAPSEKRCVCVCVCVCVCKYTGNFHAISVYTAVCLWQGRIIATVESSWNVMAHGDVQEGKWRGNWRIEWVASTLYTTSEHGVSSTTTADAHTSAARSRLNWRPPPI